MSGVLRFGVVEDVEHGLAEGLGFVEFFFGAVAIELGHEFGGGGVGDGPEGDDDAGDTGADERSR